MKCQEIEVYLSGYLDHELTQQQEQNVRLHLETCSHCSEVLNRLEEAKEATGRLQLSPPTQSEWRNMQEHILERSAQRLGWLILLVWFFSISCYGLYHYFWSEEPFFEKLLLFGLLAAVVLLFGSVLSRRLRELKSDRYRGVFK